MDPKELFINHHAGQVGIGLSPHGDADMVPSGGTGVSPFSPDGLLMYEDIDAFTTWYGDDDLKADIVSVGGTNEFPSPPDGQLTLDDVLAFINAFGNDTDPLTGRAVVSRTHSRRGYAGYEYDPGLMYTSYLMANGAPRAMWHVRHRVLDSETGRWTRRDPLGYVDGMGLYEYCMGQAVTRLDPLGLGIEMLPECPDGGGPGRTKPIRLCVYDNTNWVCRNTPMDGVGIPVTSPDDIPELLKEFLRLNPQCYIEHLQIICHGEPGRPYINEKDLLPEKPWWRETCNLFIGPTGVQFWVCNVGKGTEGKEFEEACLKHGWPYCRLDPLPTAPVRVLPCIGSWECILPWKIK